MLCASKTSHVTPLQRSRNQGVLLIDHDLMFITSSCNPEWFTLTAASFQSTAKSDDLIRSGAIILLGPVPTMYRVYYHSR